MPKRVAIGIDLGTTNSCVGVWKNGRVEIIANHVEGRRTTPSYVSYDDDDELVGDAAKSQALTNTQNSILEIKRIIGRKFSEPSVLKSIRQWSFEVFNANGAPNIRVRHQKQEKILSPEQVSAAVLSHVRETAQNYVGEVIEDAVITVPAYFNDSQRQATIDAGKIAGLNVLKLLNEPTAAAIAFGLETNNSREQTILVFDVGGGTLDVVIMLLVNKTFQVQAVGGDTHLGGSDIDSKILEHFLDFIKEQKNKDLRPSARARGRLRKACEEAKITLSSAKTSNITVDALYDGEDFVTKMSRARFEELCDDLFTKMIQVVKNVLNDSGKKKSEIDEVVLVGGTSRIPKIQELLEDLFDGKKLNNSINPDEAVAYGAASHAHSLISDDGTAHEVTLQEVIPFSLGMEGVGDVMNVFLKRNSCIPATVKKDSWTTSLDNQEGVTVSIYEGEHRKASQNNLLGRFKLHLDERAKAGAPRLAFTFRVDVNGILYVTGENTKTNQVKVVELVPTKGRLTPQEVDHLRQKNSVTLKEKTNAYCRRQKEVLEDPELNSIITQAQRMSVLHVYNGAIDWLNKQESLDDVECRRKLFDVQLKCNKLLPKIKPIGLVKQIQ